MERTTFEQLANAKMHSDKIEAFKKKSLKEVTDQIHATIMKLEELADFLPNNYSKSSRGYKAENFKIHVRNLMLQY